MTNKKKSFSSLENAIRALGLFSIEQDKIGVNEVAEQIGVAPSTAHRLLNTLRKEGFLVKDSNQYKLGVSILALGSIVQSETPIIKASNDLLKNLSNKTNETVLLGIIHNEHVLYVNKSNSKNHTGSYAYQGQQFPLHSTSAGKVLLAHKDIEFIQNYQTYVQANDDNNSNLKNLTSKLTNVREKGYAITINEHHPGVASVACGVKRRNSNIIAAIEVIGASSRFTKEALPQLINATLETAVLLSKRC